MCTYRIRSRARGVEAARSKFTPEFMNRIDKTVVFRPLGDSPNCGKSSCLELNMLQQRIFNSADGRAVRLLPDRCGQGTVARRRHRYEVRRAASEACDRPSLVHPLSNLIATEQVRGGDLIRVDYDCSGVAHDVLQRGRGHAGLCHGPDGRYVCSPAVGNTFVRCSRRPAPCNQRALVPPLSCGRFRGATIRLRMNVPVERRNARLMRAMFSTVACRYDFITRAFSYGMDRRWKLHGIRMAALPDRPVVLDLACGTGDFSRMTAQQRPHARIIAVDLTERMLQLARERGVREAVCGDATALPFPDYSFDCVFIGYGLRNFPHLPAALEEIVRVTRPGGILVSLDFFLPSNPVLRQIYLGYLYAQGAFWGTVLHGQPSVYTYIPASLRAFVSMEDLSAMLRRTGYHSVSARGYIFGGIGLHWAAKK